MLTLILGGARSGKSDLAQRIAHMSGCEVVVVATMEAGDDEMRAKIAAHRASRPARWQTVEEPLEIARAVRSAVPESAVIVDCLTLWVTNLLLRRLDPDSNAVADVGPIIDEIARAADAFADAANAHLGDAIVVSNEVGMGLVPPYPAGRAFRDALGAVNRIVAARAGRVYFVVAGLAVDLKALGAQPLDAFGESPRG